MAKKTSVKEDFVKNCVKILFRDGITKQRLEQYLDSCWTHGANTALISPEIAFDLVGKSRKRYYAEVVIDTSLVDFLYQRGMSASPKARAEVIKEMLDSDLTFPVTKLDAEETDWIIGRRSSN
jgi:hypothetical protein